MRETKKNNFRNHESSKTKNNVKVFRTAVFVCLFHLNRSDLAPAIPLPCNTGLLRYFLDLHYFPIGILIEICLQQNIYVLTAILD